jgi:RimJ/RimL family protein N-acetyltransferase
MDAILPIESERLVLRAFRKSDAAAFHGWRNDADVARYTLWDHPYPVAQAEAFCAKQAGLEPFPEGEWYQLIMQEKATGAAIGDIGVGNGVTLAGAGVASIGYSLSAAAQGRGYMTEALAVLLPALAEPLGLHRYVAEIDVRNPASARVLMKMGFRPGPVHKARSFVKGEWCDEQDFTLTVEDMKRQLVG